MENWMRKYAEKGSLAVFDSKVRVIFMILDHLIENWSHIFTIHPKEGHLGYFLQDLVFGISVTFVSIVDQNAAFFEVSLNNNFLFLFDSFDSFSQEGSDKFEDISIGFSRKMPIIKIDDGRVREHVFVDKIQDFFAGVDIWVKYGSLNALTIDTVHGSNLSRFHALGKVGWKLDFLDDLKFVWVIEDKSGFHFKDLVFEETADLLVFGVKDSEERIPDLQFVMVLSFHLFESIFVDFGKNF